MIENVIPDRVKEIINLKEQGYSNDEIASMAGFTSKNALRSFMNRQGYKSTKTGYELKDSSESNNVNSKKRTEIELKIQSILGYQNEGKSNEEIIGILNFSSYSALRSFMSRGGYKSEEGLFVKKNENINSNTKPTPVETKVQTNEKKEKNELDESSIIIKKNDKTVTGKNEKIKVKETNIIKIEINPEKENKKIEKKNINDEKSNHEIEKTNEQTEITEDDKKIAEKVLELQRYRIPFLEIAKFVELEPFLLDKLMIRQGYISEQGMFIVKPKEIPVAKTTKQKTKSKNKKIKKSKPIPQKEDSTQVMLKKYGRFDIEMGVYVVNPTVVKIMESISNKIPVDKVANELKMTSRVMHNYMKTHGYVWIKNKYIKESELLKEKEKQEKIVVTHEVEEKVILVKPEKTADIDGPIYLNEYDIKDIEQMYRWFKKNKDNKLFEIK